MFHFSIAVYSMLSRRVKNQVTVLTCTADGAMSMEWDLQAVRNTLAINYDSLRDSTLNQITYEGVKLSSTITPSSAYGNLYTIQSILEVSSSFSEGSGVLARCFGRGHNDHIIFQEITYISFFNRPIATECKLNSY